VVNAVIMMDSQSRRSRGFGFVTFDSESVVEAVLARTHVLNGKPVELKRAIPKEKMAPSTPAGPSDGYAGYDQRGPEFAYPGYGYPGYPTSYTGYSGYDYPRADGYREDYYGAGRGGGVAPSPAPVAPRGYGYEAQAPAPTSWAQPGYPEAPPPAQAYGADYSRYSTTPPRGGYGVTSALPVASRGVASRGIAGTYGSYDSAAYGASPAANGAYAYGASRTPKPERAYHPYGR